MKAINRFYIYLSENNLKPSSIEKAMGLSNGYLSAQKKRNADIGESIINKIIDYCRDINPEWLITGSGPMIREDKSEQNITGSNVVGGNIQGSTLAYITGNSDYEKIIKEGQIELTRKDALNEDAQRTIRLLEEKLKQSSDMIEVLQNALETKDETIQSLKEVISLLKK